MYPASIDLEYFVKLILIRLELCITLVYFGYHVCLKGRIVYTEKSYNSRFFSESDQGLEEGREAAAQFGRLSSARMACPTLCN